MYQTTVLSIALVTAAVGPPVMKDRLEIQFTGKRCVEIQQVWIVTDNKDGERDATPAKADSKCHWSTDVERFDADLSHFSLRLDFAEGGARTECRTVTGSGNIGQLQFQCCHDEVSQKITIDAQSKRTAGAAPTTIPVSYLREVDPLPPGMDEQRKGIPCTERSAFGKGAGTIDHIQFEMEKIYLQIGLSKPDVGLLVNDLPNRQKMMVEAVPLTAAVLVDRLARQRAAGRSKAAPNLSLQAIEIDIKKMKAINLDKLVVTVH